MDKNQTIAAKHLLKAQVLEERYYDLFKSGKAPLTQEKLNTFLIAIEPEMSRELTTLTLDTLHDNHLVGDVDMLKTLNDNSKDVILSLKARLRDVIS